jgi:hypothetical protein
VNVRRSCEGGAVVVHELDPRRAVEALLLLLEGPSSRRAQLRGVADAPAAELQRELAEPAGPAAERAP